MNKPLFEDFDAVSAKAWKQKIQVDLKGADYNDTLIWHSLEGVAVKPFYHADDFENETSPSNTKTTNWEIGQHIKVNTEKDANKKAIQAINAGAERIGFHLDSDTILVEHLLHNINLEDTLIDLFCNFNANKLINKLTNVTQSAVQESRITIHTDIIHNLAKTGNWYNNLKADHQNFETLVKTTNQLTVDLSLYQNAGATMVQQLAYGLAHANEYLNFFDNSITSEAKQSLKITFNASIGSNYFFEIAKLRALRQLWGTLASEYRINTNCQIIATPSKRNKTLYDYNTNMLRSTTECMSAILGGANTVYNLPYDAVYHYANDFGDRIARNQLLVLKHESYFDKVNNPADGVYYIEDLTTKLAEKALELFKDVEANGGFLHQLKEGTIQRKLKESATKEQTEFDNGNLVLLGTNKHPNPNDKMKADIEISPFLKKEKRKTLIAPIVERRLSEIMDKERLDNE